MIFDKIENIEQYRGLHHRIDKVIDFLKRTDISEYEKGRYAIDNDDIYVNVDAYYTKSKECAKLEAHKKYIDLQLMIKGEEYIGYAPLVDQPVIAEYAVNTDVAFFEGNYSSICLEAGMFAILFPQDLHAPCIRVNEESFVHKAVFKIRNID